MTANTDFTVPSNIVIINNNRLSKAPRWFVTRQAAINTISDIFTPQLAEELEEHFIEATRIQECVYEGTDGNYYSPIPGGDLALPLSGEYLYTPQDTYCGIYRAFSDNQNVFTCLPYELPAIPEHVYHVEELTSLMEQMSEIVDSDCEDYDALASYGIDDAREMTAQQLATNRRCVLEHLHYLADVAAMFWFTLAEEDREEQEAGYREFLDSLMNAIARSM